LVRKAETEGSAEVRKKPFSPLADFLFSILYPALGTSRVRGREGVLNVRIPASETAQYIQPQNAGVTLTGVHSKLVHLLAKRLYLFLEASAKAEVAWMTQRRHGTRKIEVEESAQ
jgi:hypothetical protein